MFHEVYEDNRAEHSEDCTNWVNIRCCSLDSCNNTVLFAVCLLLLEWNRQSVKNEANGV